MKSLTQLNTYSALPVAYDDQGTGAQTLADRYQINGLLDTAQPVMKNIEKIASAAGSWLTYDIHDGKWGVVINSSGTSVASFNDTNILGAITVSGTGLTDLYNSVKVEFPHRELKDSADFVTIDIPGGDRNANEETNALNLVYDIINEPVQAQLLGFIELKQSRIDLVIQFQSDYSNINLKAGEIIDVTNSRFGFTNKLFRIQSITEQQDEEGALRVGITALEYDANVYSTADLFRYTRTDSNGIITIGSIGKPSTPQITKFETDARPRVIIESLAPTGLVEGMEFWVTSDVNVPVDANRSYSLIATVRPVKPEDNGIFASGAQVVAETTSLPAGSFFVKSRGFNSVVVGQFSDPSGLIEYVPKQITDGIGPDTGVFDETGTLLTAFAASLLMNKVSDLILGSVSSSSLFQSIFDAFEDVTGIDLVGEASSGDLVVASNLSIADEGTTISPTTSRINFVGSGVTASGNGVVTVNIGGGGGGGTGGGLVITSISPSSGPTAGGTSVTITGINLTGASGVTFGGTAATNVVAVSSTQVTCRTPAKSTSTVDVVVTTPLGTTSLTQGFTYVDPVVLLSINSRYPPDRATGLDPLNGAASNLAPINGSYYLIIGGATWGPLQTGSGSAKLYKSDGTLAETLSAGSLIIDGNLVEFPFAAREPGVDYYILLDQGLLTYCNAVSPAITTASPWNFNTPLYSEKEFIKIGDWLNTAEGQAWPRTETQPGVFELNRPLPYYVIEFGGAGSIPTTTATIAKINGISVYAPKGSAVPLNSVITITWSTSVKAGSGSVKIYTTATDSLVGTIAVTSTSSVSGNVLTVGSIRPFVDYETEYYVTADAGVVLTDLDYDCFFAPSTPSQAVVKADNVTFKTIPALELNYWQFKHDPFPNDAPTIIIPFVVPADKQQRVNPQTNIVLVFNRAIAAGEIGNFSLYTASGAIHQRFDITDTFESDKVSELISISGSTVTLNPTEDLEFGATYYLQATPGVVTDGIHPWGGITNTTKIRFRVDPGPEPVISPINNDSDTIVLSFDREIQPGAGKVQIYDQLGNFITEIDSDDPSISYS